MLHDKIHRWNKLELEDNEVKTLISLKLNTSSLASNLPSRLNRHTFDFSPPLRQDTIRFQTILPTLLTRPTLRKEGGEFWKVKLVPPVLKSFGNSNRIHNREPKCMKRNVLPHENM